MSAAIIGSGKVGATLARRLTGAGNEVTLASSRGGDHGARAAGRLWQPGSFPFGTPLAPAQTARTG